MRWPWALAVVLASATSEARPSGTPRAPEDRTDFWREVIEPNGEQVKKLLITAREVMSRPDSALGTDSDWAVDHRARFYRDAYNLLRYARRLSPHNVDVLTELGRAADELGHTREAIEALEACARITGPERANAIVTSRLGAIYLRLGEVETAIRWLRLAQGPLAVQNAAAVGPALVHLASALSARGDLRAAIETLTNALPPVALGHYSDEMTLVAFALAVLYDRDEQRGAAFDVLDDMQGTLQQSYAAHVQNELVKLRFAKPEDLHYYRALLYESLGHYVEARAEWAHYAAISDAPWRGRALEHVAAIDAQRRAAPGPITAAPPPPSILRRRIPRP